MTIEGWNGKIFIKKGTGMKNKNSMVFEVTCMNYRVVGFSI